MLDTVVAMPDVVVATVAAKKLTEKGLPGQHTTGFRIYRTTKYNRKGAEALEITQISIRVYR
jgi:hypothetical protein